ncbi:DsbA family protein [Bacillaceae bacterium Marseille-Q3522]|nr:DsbA family protein [Bacillaceae bacterium Marseille-Q3522]
MRNQESNSYDTVSPHCHGSEKKPIEIYKFIDPFCPDCWAIEPVIKKLLIEYGRYFSIKHVLSGRLKNLNRVKKRRTAFIYNHCAELEHHAGIQWIENPISSPYIASIAIKAAELQGRKLCARFIRQLQEKIFLGKENIEKFSVLQECAKQVGLDVDEFISDIHSDSVAKAFQCDLKITVEMDVQEIPTLVFFNENIEEEGIKISGAYPYEVYEQIIEEMLEEKPVPATPPPIEAFLKYFKLVATKEISIVYNMPIEKAETELKKLQLKQLVESVPVKNGMFWRYLKND